MKRVKEEAEVIIRLDYMDKLAHITVSAWPSMNAKMLKRYGVSKDGRNTPRTARWSVPLKAISFRSLASGKHRKGGFLASGHRSNAQGNDS